MSTYTERRNGGGVPWRVGEIRRLEHVVRDADPDGEFVVASVACTVYDPNGAVVLSAEAGAVENAAPDNSHAVYYLWNTTGRPAGRYTYTLTYVIGAETFKAHGEQCLLDGASRLDRWVARVRDLLLDSRASEATGLLTVPQYRERAQEAATVYSKDFPRQTYQEYALTTAFEYDLPLAWEPGLSRVVRLEYPVDDTEQLRCWQSPDYYEVDEPRGKWRFTVSAPTAGERARLYFSAAHILDDYQDTVPVSAFDGVALYAAGLALLALGAKGARTDAPQFAAEMANYRDLQQKCLAQGKEFLARGRAAWAGPKTWAVYL